MLIVISLMFGSEGKYTISIVSPTKNESEAVFLVIANDP
jgi:hypothetical protein